MEGRARLRQAAATGTRRPRAARSSPTPSSANVGDAVRVRFRPLRRARARHRPRDQARACGSSLRSPCRCSSCRSSPASRSRCCWRSSAHTLPRFLGRGAVRGAAVDLERCSTSSAGSTCSASCCTWCRSPATPAASMRVKFLVLPVLLSADRAARQRGARCTARCSWRRSARTTCAPRAPRACPRRVVLFRHVLQNALIPILTGAVVVISATVPRQPGVRDLLRHPGAGQLHHRRHQAQDFAVVRSMVFLGSVLYIAACIAHRHLLHLGRSARAAGLS